MAIARRATFEAESSAPFTAAATVSRPLKAGGGAIVNMSSVAALRGSPTATINHTDFGLTWNKTLEKGGVLVGLASPHPPLTTVTYPSICSRTQRGPFPASC